MVPSSAKVPCMMGKAKSNGWKAPESVCSPGRDGSTTRWTGVAAVASRPSLKAACASSGCTHRPSRVMPTGTIVVLARVEHARHECSRGERDVVLGGAAAEDERELQHAGR